VPESLTPQTEFDQKYISSVEICAELAVTRSAVLIRRAAGKLPDGIELRRNGDQAVPLVVLWERERIRPHLDAWKADRAGRAA
jgi:hypothetical protein